MPVPNPAEYEEYLKKWEAAAGWLPEPEEEDDDPSGGPIHGIPGGPTPIHQSFFFPRNLVGGQRPDDPSTPTYVPGNYHNDGAHIIRPTKP